MTIAEIDAAIAALEAKALRPIRALSLDPLDLDALNRIASIEGEITMLRVQRAEALAAQAVTVAVVAVESLVGA